MKKVGIVMGSDSDMPVVKKAIETLDDYEIEYEVHIFSAHRTPDETIEFARNSRENNFGVIIAFAGKAAHLAGIIAANTTLPVIGVPINSSLGGIDALLSTVQMPPGIPVATVAVDGGKNAAVLSAQILSLQDEKLEEKIKEQRKQMRNVILEKNNEIEKKLNLK